MSARNSHYRINFLILITKVWTVLCKHLHLLHIVFASCSRKMRASFSKTRIRIPQWSRWFMVLTTSSCSIMMKYHGTALFDAGHKNDCIALILYVGPLIRDHLLFFHFIALGKFKIGIMNAFIYAYVMSSFIVI